MTRYYKMAWSLLLTVVPVLVAGGCLVGNDEYDEARRQKEQYRVELNELHQANDFLNKEIARIYNDCEILSSQLALTAALTIHDRYTAGLQRPQPIVTATTPGRTTPAARPGASATRPSTPAARPSTPAARPSTPATRPSTPATRPGSGSGTAAPPASPPPTSSPSPGFMGGGSVDLGI